MDLVVLRQQCVKQGNYSNARKGLVKKGVSIEIIAGPISDWKDQARRDADILAFMVSSLRSDNIASATKTKKEEP